MNPRTADVGGAPSRPSREDIECLCILHAVGKGGCFVADLAGLLGLSPGLSPAISEGIKPLIAAGWLQLHDDRLTRTDQGAAWLQDRLAAFLKGPPPDQSLSRE